MNNEMEYSDKPTTFQIKLIKLINRKQDLGTSKPFQEINPYKNRLLSTYQFIKSISRTNTQTSNHLHYIDRPN